MELKGLKINFLGDSITQGSCATTPEKSYVEVLKQQYGLAAARNYGIGGTRIARQRKPSEVAKYDLDFVHRAGDMDKNADVIFVFGGTNDHGHGDAPFGQDTDRTPDTFCGACHCLYRLLLESYPGAKIVVATPLHRAVETREDGITLEDYVNQIRRAAAQYPVHLLDLYGQSEIRAHIPEVAAYLTEDGLHPNDLGHNILAREIGEYLKTL